MPITIQATEGLMGRKHLIASFSPFGEGRSYADGEPVSYVNVTLRIPTFSLDTHAKREEFVTRMSALLVEKAEGRLPKDRVYINMIYGDGVWGVEGVAYTDAMLLSALIESGRK